MSVGARLQPDPTERLKVALKNCCWDHDFLDKYVRELELRRTEEFIFIMLAFDDAKAGNSGAFHGGGILVTDVYSEWYEPLDISLKGEVRRWWHELVRWEANQFDDLKARLSKLS